MRTGVEIGDTELEQHYIINTNNTAKLQTLLSKPKIRQIILAQTPYLLTNQGQPAMLSKPFPAGVSELLYATGGDYFPFSLDNIDAITSVYDLFEEIMNQLCAMCSASEDDPDMR